ncbi:MAG: hypothetical protein LBH47_02250 [Christensenellaceae bacterium]|jgi:N-glycosylase/DNA lyase|nr:hypothetical protein [Christensenellaceae bacterium]
MKVIDISEIEHFNAASIANSGQVFRAEIKGGGIHFISGCEYAIVEEDKILSTNDLYFENYFDLAADLYGKGDVDFSYKEIQKTILLNTDILQACDGVRILRGNFVETVISFIISANNSIKRIKGSIDLLCKRYGKRLNFRGHEYFGFPLLERLEGITVDDWRSLGCGYRSLYLLKTVLMLKDISFDELCQLNNEGLYERLIRLSGVGDKVARCIMLFAFHRLDIMPVDRWILKSAEKFIESKERTIKGTAAEMEKYFGRFGGVAQQYIYYYTQFLGRKIE